MDGGGGRPIDGNPIDGGGGRPIDGKPIDGQFSAQPDEFLHGFGGRGDAGLAGGEFLQDGDAHGKGPVRR